VSLGFPSRWLRVSSTACSAFVFLLVAGCGGSAETPPPQLPARVAATLDAEAADVEEALDANDPAAALAQAEELRAAAEAAIAAGDVPRRLRRPLRSGIGALIASIEVPEEPPPPPPPPPPSTTEPPPAPEPPPAEECGPLEQLRDGVVKLLEALPEDDPARAPLEQELAALEAALAECQAAGTGQETGNGKGRTKGKGNKNGNGGGDDEGDG
jgi:hypothetical protein